MGRHAAATRAAPAEARTVRKQHEASALRLQEIVRAHPELAEDLAARAEQLLASGLHLSPGLREPAAPVRPPAQDAGAGWRWSGEVREAALAEPVRAGCCLCQISMSALRAILWELDAGAFPSGLKRLTPKKKSQREAGTEKVALYRVIEFDTRVQPTWPSAGASRGPSARCAPGCRAGSGRCRAPASAARGT